MLTQAKYIRDLLAKTNMSEAKPIASPLVAGCKVTKSETEPLTDATQFRSIIGALQYVTITRPELSFSVNKVCQFMSQPREPHWTAVKRILRYLKVTLTWVLSYYQLLLIQFFLFRPTVMQIGQLIQMADVPHQVPVSFWDPTSFPVGLKSNLLWLSPVQELSLGYCRTSLGANSIF